MVVRQGLLEALAADRSIEVAGSASDGSIALKKIRLLQPDLLIFPELVRERAKLGLLRKLKG